MKRTFNLWQPQRGREDTVRMERVYEIVTDDMDTPEQDRSNEVAYSVVESNLNASLLVSDTTTHQYDTVTNIQRNGQPSYSTIPSVPLSSPTDDSSGLDDPHRVYDIVTDDSALGLASSGRNGLIIIMAEDRLTDSPSLGVASDTGVHGAYDVVTKEPSSAGTQEGIYNTLDYTKPQTRQDSSEGAYDTLQHVVKIGPVQQSMSETVYDTIDKHEAVKAAAPSQAVCSSLGNAIYSVVDKKRNKTFTVDSCTEGFDKYENAGKCVTDCVDKAEYANNATAIMNERKASPLVPMLGQTEPSMSISELDPNFTINAQKLPGSPKM